MSETLTIDFNEPIPLFPLDHCALLPHASIPLHVFEPRYRKMVHDALDSHGLLALATYRDAPRQGKKRNARSAVRPYVCVALIARHQRLSDGRYNILLQGICRARIHREIRSTRPDATTPYRIALLRPADGMAKDQPMEIDLHDSRQKLERLIRDPTLRELASINAIHNWLSDEIPTAVMVDLTILTLCSNVDQRYAMLAETSVQRRADWLDRHLRQTRDTLKTADAMGASLSDDGLNLN